MSRKEAISLSSFLHFYSCRLYAVNYVCISLVHLFAINFEELLQYSCSTYGTTLLSNSVITHQLAFQACRMSGWSMPSRSASSSSTSNSHFTTAGGSSSAASSVDAVVSMNGCSIAVEAQASGDVRVAASVSWETLSDGNYCRMAKRSWQNTCWSRTQITTENV